MRNSILAWSWTRLALSCEENGLTARARENFRKVVDLIGQDFTLSQDDQENLRDFATRRLEELPN
jgi:hypothetical protein